MELRGVDSAELLARLCRIDLAVGIVRSDRDGQRCYLLYVDRSYRQSFVEMLLDVGEEFGL